MSVPRNRSVRSVQVVLAGLLVVVATGCTGSPRIAGGTMAEAQQRILALVNATGGAIGSPTQFSPVHAADELPCVKKVLGYTVKHLAAHQAEVPVQISIKGKRDGASLLPRVEAYWKSLGYKINTSGLSDHRYPKIRTRVGDDLLVATGYVAVPQMNLYAVSPCVKT